MTICQAIEKCINSIGNTRAKNTQKTYKNGLARFAEFLVIEGFDLKEDISSLPINQFIFFPAWLSGLYKKQTAELYATAAKKFLTWLVIGGHIEPTMSETMRLDLATKEISGKKEAYLPRFPEEEDVETMLMAVREYPWSTHVLRLRNVALLEILACTGCRVSEICNLLILDMSVDFETAIVTGKGSKQRIVYLSQQTIRCLQSYWKERGPTEKSHPVFSRHDRAAGKKILPITIRTAEHIVDQVRGFAGIEKFTPHYFRHAFAIKALQESDNLALVQDFLGHASPVATRVYAKIRPRYMQEQYNRIFDEED
jgi:integrase/recombinase XerC